MPSAIPQSPKGVFFDLYGTLLILGDMKRAWSEQTTLNLKSITSVNLVSFGIAKDAFAYEVDEIGFY